MCPTTVRKVEKKAARQDVRKAYVVYKYSMTVNAKHGQGRQTGGGGVGGVATPPP